MVVRAREQSQPGTQRILGGGNIGGSLKTDRQIPLHAVCSRSNLKTQHGLYNLGMDTVCVTAVASAERGQAAAHTSCRFQYLCHLQ